MNYTIEKLITYLVFMFVFVFMCWIYLFICEKYKDKKNVYKWLIVIPYIEAIISTIGLSCFLNNIQIKVPRIAAFSLLAFVLGYSAVLLGILYCIKTNLT